MTTPLSNQIIREITPLSDKDCFYIAERYKTEFTYPIHNHSEFELNFTEKAAGVRRIVGDSSEVIGDYDLVLITGKDLEHVWEQNECRSKEIREITIQFSSDLFFKSFINKNQFDSIRRMLDKAQKGLCFPMSAILKIYPLLDTLASEKQGFYAVIKFMTILYELSLFEEEARTLSSSSFCQDRYSFGQPACAESAGVYQYTLSGRNTSGAVGRYGGDDGCVIQPLLQAAYRQESFRLYH